MNPFRWLWRKFDNFMEDIFGDMGFHKLVKPPTRIKVTDEMEQGAENLRKLFYETRAKADGKPVEHNIFYGVSSPSSQVYHVLGEFDLASVAESLCHMTEVGLDKSFGEPPTDKRLCKLCEGVITDENDKAKHIE